MTDNSSGGTLSHRLNASMSFPRISFPGFAVVYVNGSKSSYTPTSNSKSPRRTKNLTDSFLEDHCGSWDSVWRILSYLFIAILCCGEKQTSSFQAAAPHHTGPRRCPDLEVMDAQHAQPPGTLALPTPRLENAVWNICTSECFTVGPGQWWRRSPFSRL